MYKNRKYGISIPVHLACLETVLPSELHILTIILIMKKTCALEEEAQADQTGQRAETLRRALFRPSTLVVSWHRLIRILPLRVNVSASKLSDEMEKDMAPSSMSCVASREAVEDV